MNFSIVLSPFSAYNSRLLILSELTFLVRELKSIYFSTLRLLPGWEAKPDDVVNHLNQSAYPHTYVLLFRSENTQKYTKAFLDLVSPLTVSFDVIFHWGPAFQSLPWSSQSLSFYYQRLNLIA